MKKVVFIIISILVIAFLKPVLMPVFSKNDSPNGKLGAMPVLESGRVKPLDSVARSTLLIFRGKQSIRVDGETITAMEWFSNVLFDRKQAEALPVFRIDHPHIVSLLGYESGTRKYFSYDELKPWLAKVQEQARMVDDEAKNRNAYERAVLTLFSNLIQYQQLTQTVYPVSGLRGSVDTYYNNSIDANGRSTTSTMGSMQMRQRQLGDMAQSPLYLFFNTTDWENSGGLLQNDNLPDALAEEAKALARVADAKQSGDANAFASAVDEYLTLRTIPSDVNTGLEYYYNGAQLFIVSMELYVLAMLLVFVAWQFSLAWLLRMTYWIVCIGFTLHTIGLVMRVAITGYAPVTNLYSSAVFVGWIAVILSLFFERFQKKGIGSIAAAIVGFLTLLVAHHLADNGDTMEKMRAVLNSNFWLSTHVITITMGYGATFLGGFLGIVYIIYGWLSRSIDTELQKSFHRMLYASVAFALLFSFVGTVLGGIWADQSWGRFWGWDPKENGALMIVLWTSLILHALRGGMIKTRGLVHLCIVGNIVTAWSWFGTNMLGVGLHSYGFMDSAFFWLVIFWLSQFLIMGLEWLFPVQLKKVVHDA